MNKKSRVINQTLINMIIAALKQGNLNKIKTLSLSGLTSASNICYLIFAGSDI
jgi:hypothetical protein